MEQHPVPQDIATYQFRLVGNMTLKQFLELASGIVVAVLLYTTPLYAIFKWPLIFFFVFAGAAFAFMPIQERPMDVWIRNFLRSIYSPTRFLWKKEENLPDFLTYQVSKNLAASLPKLTPAERLRFAEYVKSLPTSQSLTPFDLAEKTNLDKINQFLTKVSGSVKPSIPSPPITPLVEIANPFTPPMEIGTPFKDLPAMRRRPKPKPKPIFVPIKPKPKIKVAPTIVPLPIPTLPELPNVIVGMTLDKEGKILPNAIIEIRDKHQMPVRASKTNKLGQFFIATPLPTGDYELEVEAQPLVFDIIKFKAEGKIIPPLKIQAVN